MATLASLIHRTAPPTQTLPCAVGGGPVDCATLAEPQSGSLVLAGEAASAAHPSTVLGAWLSGREAAYRVLDAAAELPQCGSVPGSLGVCVAPPPPTGSSSGAELLCGCQELPASGESVDEVSGAAEFNIDEVTV